MLCPIRTIYKSLLPISVFESEFSCFIYNADECYEEAKKQGFEPGDSTTTPITPFKSTYYSNKLCYAFDSSFPQHKNKAFFGLGGTLKDVLNSVCKSEKDCVTLYKPCLRAGKTNSMFRG